MTSIRLHASVFPLAFLVLLFPPRVSLDGGEPRTVSWKGSELPVTPGSHQLVVFVPYFFVFQIAKVEIEVTVEDGKTVDVAYRAPWLVFLPGKIRVLDANQPRAA